MKKIGVIGMADRWSSEALSLALKSEGMQAEIIDMKDVHWRTDTGDIIWKNHNLLKFDAFVIKKVSADYSPDMLDRLELLQVLENAGIPFFSKPSRVASTLNRFTCTRRLVEAGIKMPPTVVTESMEAALLAVSNFGRVVLKPLYTSKARGMKIVSDGPEAKTALESFCNAGNRVMYIQKYIDMPEQDVGLVFMGGNYLCAYARARDPGSWNTTTENGGTYRRFVPDADLVALAWQAQDRFGLDFTSVDIVLTAEGPLVFEVSAFGSFRGPWEADGFDSAKAYARYVVDRL